MAARSTGAREWHAFRTAALPLILPAIASGALCAFIMSLDRLIITALIAQRLERGR